MAIREYLSYQGCDVTISGVVTADTAQYNSPYGAYALKDYDGQWGGLVLIRTR